MPTDDPVLTAGQVDALREQLLRQRERVLRANASLEAVLDHDERYGLDDSSDAADVGNAHNALERASIMAQRGGERLLALDDALERLEVDPESFGRCTVCKEAISFDRLEILPTTRTCQAHAA